MATYQERTDSDKAQALAAGTAMSAFNTALTAAKASVAALNVTVQADGGAAGGTKTASTATAALVAALSTADIAAYTTY